MNFPILLWLKLAVVLHFELINLVWSKSCSSVSSECSVKIKHLGQVSGIQLNTVFGGKPFCGYKGIRFGQAPVGDLRFKVCYGYLKEKIFIFFFSTFFFRI